MATTELVDIDHNVLETKGKLIGYCLGNIYSRTPEYNTGSTTPDKKNIILGYACYKWEGNLYICNIKETESGVVKTIHKITY